MTYLIIEHFKPGMQKLICQRFDQKGRMLPEGVTYVDSWTNLEIETCYQIMTSDSIDKLKEWTASWADLVEFEIIPVITSTEARKQVFLT